MRRWILFLVVAAFAASADNAAQTRRPAARQPARPVPPKVEPAVVTCPQLLGDGVKTQRSFCDVQIGRDVNGGVIIAIPPHAGDATLTFDLHNRHTYSEEQVKANRAYHRYTATIGVLAMDNTLLSRALIQSEFRTAADLFDRITGGTGPGGLKAVAPTGVEPIAITIPQDEERVSILGERLTMIRVDSDRLETFTVQGRPIAVISNVMIEYRPAPVRRPATRR